MGVYRREEWLIECIFSLCLLFALIALLSSCSQVTEENSLTAKKDIPDAQFYDLIRNEYREGKLSMQFSAKHASWYETDRRLEVEELAFITYNAMMALYQLMAMRNTLYYMKLVETQSSQAMCICRVLKAMLALKLLNLVIEEALMYSRHPLTPKF